MKAEPRGSCSREKLGRTPLLNVCGRRDALPEARREATGPGVARQALLARFDVCCSDELIAAPPTLRGRALSMHSSEGRSMSSELQYESLTTVSDLIRRKRLSSAELTDATLRRIAQLDGHYHAYATVVPERALTQAKTADAEIARGLWRGPLHGVPIAVKDLCYTTFAPTCAGTTIFEAFTPSFNATVVERLED